MEFDPNAGPIVAVFVTIALLVLVPWALYEFIEWVRSLPDDDTPAY